MRAGPRPGQALFAPAKLVRPSDVPEVPLVRRTGPRQPITVAPDAKITLQTLAGTLDYQRVSVQELHSALRKYAAANGDDSLDHVGFTVSFDTQGRAVDITERSQV